MYLSPKSPQNLKGISPHLVLLLLGLTHWLCSSLFERVLPLTENMLFTFLAWLTPSGHLWNLLESQQKLYFYVSDFKRKAQW